MFFLFINTIFSCYLACPPWYSICTKQCVDRPWYKQSKYIKLMKTDPEFLKIAQKYLPKFESNEIKPCFSACPPWFKTCITDCVDKPWFQQEFWINKMKYDPEFRTIAYRYLYALKKPASESNSGCYSACPPWYEICTMQCVDRPWYKQHKYIELMRTDSEFRKIAEKYLKIK